MAGFQLGKKASAASYGSMSLAGLPGRRGGLFLPPQDAHRRRMRKAAQPFFAFAPARASLCKSAVEKVGSRIADVPSAHSKR